MHYVIHTNVFKETSWNVLMNWIQRNNISYEILPWKPYVSSVKIKSKRKDIWCWGSVSLSKLAHKYKWKPGSMLNKNHDIEVYGKYYGKNMLNHDGITMCLADPLPDWAEYFFARPTKDTKSFTGQLFSREAWNEWVAQALEVADNNDHISAKPPLMRDTKVQIAPLKQIEQEIRCWVVNGKVVTASRYKLGARVIYQNYDDESYFIEFAQKMVDLYQPAEAFVIDICLANGELKVVEINCINCSGFYHGNMNKLMEAVENHFTKTPTEIKTKNLQKRFDKVKRREVYIIQIGNRLITLK